MSHDTPLTEKQQFWLEHIQSCARTGLSMKDYAQSHALNVGAFYTWKKTLRRKGVIGPARTAPSPLFHKAVISPALVGTARVQLVSGVTLEVDAGTDPHWVGALVRALS